MCAQQRADVRQQAVTIARVALGEFWQHHLGSSWWEILADPGTRADALWEAAGAMVVAVEPILEVPLDEHPDCAKLQRERDFFAGQAEALRTQVEHLLTHNGTARTVERLGDRGSPRVAKRPAARTT